MKEVSSEGVQQQVGEVELEGRARTKDPVQAEGEGGQRPVRLVRTRVREWNAPEVRGDQGREGRRACYNRVGQHRRPGMEDNWSAGIFLQTQELSNSRILLGNPHVFVFVFGKRIQDSDT